MCNFRSQEIGVLKPPKPLVQGAVITFVLFTMSWVLELPKAFYGNSEAADRKAAADRIKRNPQNVRTLLPFASPSMLSFSHGYLSIQVFAAVSAGNVHLTKDQKDILVNRKDPLALLTEIVKADRPRSKHFFLVTGES